MTRNIFREQNPLFLCISRNTASRKTNFVPIESETYFHLFVIHYINLNCSVLQLFAESYQAADSELSFLLQTLKIIHTGYRLKLLLLKRDLSFSNVCSLSK